MITKFAVLVLVCVLVTAEARYKNPYLTDLQSMPGMCLDCGYMRQVCGLKNPCKLNDCEKACITPKSYLDYRNGHVVERQGTCDLVHQTDVFHCLDDISCAKTQICCHTATGSYCH